MLNLREQLQQCFEGSVCLMGLGNVDYGDDGFGVRLAEAMIQTSEFVDINPVGDDVRSLIIFPNEVRDSLRPLLRPKCSKCLIAGTNPEHYIGQIEKSGIQHLIFLDAVNFGGEPGAVVFLNSEEMTTRFPQISTHKISLGLLAQWAESSGATKAWLLGVQPESTKPGIGLSPVVAKTMAALQDLLNEVSMEVPA